MEQVYTLAQAADLCFVQPVTLRKYCLSGRIGRKFGNQWVITAEEIEAVREMSKKPGRPRKS